MRRAKNFEVSPPYFACFNTFPPLFHENYYFIMRANHPASYAYFKQRQYFKPMAESKGQLLFCSSSNIQLRPRVFVRVQKESVFSINQSIS